MKNKHQKFKFRTRPLTPHYTNLKNLNRTTTFVTPQIKGPFENSSLYDEFFFITKYNTIF